MGKESRTNSGVKLLSLFIYVWGVALLKEFPPLILALTISSLLFLSLWDINALKKLIAGNFFLLFIWFIIPFTYPGHPILKIAGIPVTMEGVKYSLMITLKLNTILMASIFVFSKATMNSLISGFKWLKIPDKLILLFFFIYRYWEIFLRTTENIRNSIKLRGFKPTLNLHTYKTYGYIVGGLLTKGFLKGEMVSYAMRCRGFDGRFKQTVKIHTNRIDYALIFSSIILTVFLMVMEWKM